MGRFEELGQNKNIIVMKLIENDKIVKCLINNQINFLEVDIPTDFDRTSLVFSNLFPYKFIPTIGSEAKTYITMSFNYKPNGMSYKNGSIWLYIIVHNSLLRTDYGTLRYDFFDQSNR